jgi:TonB family protein
LIAGPKASIAVAFMVFAMFGGTLLAQTPQRDQAIDRLAETSASQISTTHPKRILLSPLQNCLRESSICSQLETALRNALGNVSASSQFVGRDEVSRALTQHRLMEIDAYDDEVLRWIASDLRADLLVTEDLMWNPKINGLSTELIDVIKEQSIGKYIAPLADPVSTSDEPVLVKDEKSEVSLIVFYSPTSGIKVPTCDSCPAPSFSAYSDELRRTKYQSVVRLRATVTAEGAAKEIAVIGALNPLLAQSAIDTVRQWHFHPAIGADGKPFPTRRPVEVTFRLQ